MSYEFSYKVNNVNDEGVAAITVKYENILYETVTPQGSMSYDSKNPPAQVPQELSIMVAVLGQTFDVELSDQGKTILFTGLDQVIKNIISSVEYGSPQEKSWLENQINKDFSQANMSKNIENIFLFIPEKSVSVGDSWVKETYIATNIPRTMNYTWTLKSIDNGLATILTTATIKNDPHMSKTVQGSMTKEIKAVGQQEGTIIVDLKTGWVQTSDMEQTLQSTVIMVDKSKSQEPQRQSFEMTNTETYRSL